MPSTARSPRDAAVFKNPQTGYFYTELQLPGYGKLRRRSLRTKRKSEARLLENAIKETHRRGLLDPRLFQLLDAIQGKGKGASGDVSPEELLIAVRSPDGAEAGLQRLLRRLDDPTLVKVVDQYLKGEHNQKVTREDRIAFPTVIQYAEAEHGTGCPVSVLTEPDAVERLLHAVERREKKLRNSVVRYEKRAVSKLLTYRYGRSERDRIMREVRYEQADDRRRLRETVVTPAAIGRLLDELREGYYKAGDEAAPLYVRLAITTGATVRPLSEAVNRNLQKLPSGAGVLYLAGTKKIKGRGSRDRDVTIPQQLMPDVLEFYREDCPDEQLFPLDRTRFDTMFKKARKRAGLMEAVLDGKGKPTPLRPHDLRRVFAMLGEQAGVSRTKLGQGGLGHTNLDQTDRYLSRETRVDDAEASLIAEMMGW